MKQYYITGMSCAACSNRVEKAVSKVDGVTDCVVNLLTNSMGVEGTAKEWDIILAVKEAGYGAELKDNVEQRASALNGEEREDFNQDTQTMANRLIWSIVLLLFLMYLSMGHMMWNWWIPSFLQHNPLSLGITQLLIDYH